MSTERPPEAHDVLLIPRLLPLNTESGPGSGMLKMSVQENGEYAASTPLGVEDAGGRKAYSVARPSDDYGPAFAVLPIRPEPGTQSDTCYLINTENLFLPNPWTASDWDALPPEGELQNPPQTAARNDAPTEWREDGFDLLVAGPRGKVFRVQWNGQTGGIEQIAVAQESELWAQLREGLIVGTAKHQDEILPIVNVTSLNNKRQGSGGKS
jgi:hypothetical protein